MKKLIILVILLFAEPVLGATAYTKTMYGTNYYDTSATCCDDVTSGDAVGDVEAAIAAVGVDGEVILCSDITEPDSITMDDNGVTVDLNGFTLTGYSGALFIFNADSITIHGSGTLCAPATFYPLFIVLNDGCDDIAIQNLIIDKSEADIAYAIYAYGTTIGITNIELSEILVLNKATPTTYDVTIIGNVDGFDIKNLISVNANYSIRVGGAPEGDPLSVTIYNSTIYNASTACIWVEDDATASEITVKNCIFLSGPCGIDDDDVGSDPVVGYNCYYDLTSNVSGCGIGTNNVLADPKLVDTADADNLDLHLLVSSPCIDAGDNLTATVLTDIDGQDADHVNMDGDADGSVTDMDIGADQVLFLSVLTGATTLQYNLLDGEDDNVAGLAIDGGQTIDNVTIGRCKSGAIRVMGNQTINNLAIDDECYVASGATLTANNSAFQESKVTAAGDGSITDTDCLFSQSDFGFRDKSISNFRPTQDSVLKDAGYATGAGSDLDGRPVPRSTGYSIGAYRCGSGGVIE